MKVGYVVKRYPRFSETFIVNEILAHEEAQQEIEIISIRPCNDTHFQDRIARVKAPLTQLSSAAPKANALLKLIRESQTSFPQIWDVMASERFADAISIHQAILLAKHVTTENISHLHAHFATLPATVARLAAKIAGITYSLTAHAKDIYHESVVPDDLREKLAEADAVVTVSHFNVDHLKSSFPECAKNVHMVYNGMDLEALPHVAPDNRAASIIGVGRLVEKKGFADLVRACSLLKSKGVSFTCRIVGGGEEQQALTALISEFDVQDVLTLMGPMPQAQLKSLVQEASVLAAPCIVGSDGNRDGLPTVLLEAMALGTPCVSTDVTGIPEVIRHEQSGLIVSQRDPTALAEALERCLVDNALRVKLSDKAREIIETDFDAKRTSAQIREIFADAVRRNKESESANVMAESI